MSLPWPISRGERTGASDYQGMEAPCPLYLTQKWTPGRETKHQNMKRGRETHREGEAETQGIRMPPRRENPPGTNRNLGAGRGRKGVANGRRKRRQTQSCSTGRRDKWWRLAGVGNVQVDGFLLRESSWGEGSIERCWRRPVLSPSHENGHPEENPSTRI